MSKKQEFIKYVNELIAATPAIEMNPDAQTYWASLCNIEEKEKPLLTNNGKIVLKFLQDNAETEMWKSRDIAEALFISSRTVAGSLRKIVADGYVEKLGDSPAVYSLTEKGKNFNIEENS